VWNYVSEGRDAGLGGNSLLRYIGMRANGESHNIAEMLATRSFPGFVTDDIFLKGNKTGEQFADSPELGAYYRSVAEGQGVSTTGKTYLSGLAAYPGDPRAWVSGRSDVLAVARERNYNVEGLVEHRGHEVEPAADVPIAQDILVREAARFRAEGMKMDEAMAKAYSLRTGSHDIGQPQLVNDDVPHPEEVLRDDGL
jgi:hypothetical protein